MKLLQRPNHRRMAGSRRIRWIRRERGSSPIEFAIIALPMIMLTFAIVQVGLVYFANSIALGAATQGVNAARGYGSDADAGTTRTRNFLAAAGAGLDDQQVEVSRTATDVRVTVRGKAISVLPGLTWGISRTAHGPVERVTAP